MIQNSSRHISYVTISRIQQPADIWEYKRQHDHSGEKVTALSQLVALTDGNCKIQFHYAAPLTLNA